MNPFSPDLGDEMERRIREDSAEDLAALFRKHGLVPCQGDIFPELDTSSKIEKCGVEGAILIDLLNSTRPSDLMLALLYQDGAFPSAIDAFLNGFDGVEWDDLSYQYMHEKGKQVWELATQQKEQA